MRLTLVISSLGSGGAERVMSTLADEWVRTGHQVTLITLATPDTDFYTLDPRVRRVALGVLRVSSGPVSAVGANLRRVWRLRGAILGSRPDAVVSFMDRTNVLTLLATLGLSTRVIVSDRADPVALSPGKLWALLRKLLYRTASAIVCQTEAVRQWTARSTGSRRIIVIPNPLSREFHEPVDAERRPSIVALGRLVHEKGFDTLIAAFASIAGRWPDWSLVIAGDGPNRDLLESQTRRAGCEERIVFAGRTSDPQVLLSSASVFVLPSRCEGFPNALLEAMACGCAVIATDCSNGPAEIIQDGRDGVLVPVDRSDRLAAALDEMLQDAERRSSLGNAARLAVQRFDLTTIAERWICVFGQREDFCVVSRAKAHG